MSRTVTSTLVARRFVKISDDTGLTPLQLQKLAFLTHGWSYPILRRPLISEVVEAWKYGPVYPELYDVLRQFKAEEVDYVAASLRERLANRRRQKKVKLKNREKELIKLVYNKYGSLTGPELISLTHRKETPWRKSKKNGVIQENVIKKFFNEQYKNRTNGYSLL